MFAIVCEATGLAEEMGGFLKKNKIKGGGRVLQKRVRKKERKDST